MSAVPLVCFTLTILFFVLVFYGPWQTHCIDWARQRMFEQRDQLFDAAFEGKIDFKSSDYLETRLSIERMIRFCHHLSWQRSLVRYLALRFALEEGEMRNTRPKGSGSEITSKAEKQVARIIVVCIATRSLFFCPIYIAAKLMHFAMGGKLAGMLYALAQNDSADMERPIASHRGAPTGAA